MIPHGPVRPAADGFLTIATHFHWPWSQAIGYERWLTNTTRDHTPRESDTVWRRSCKLAFVASSNGQKQKAHTALTTMTGLPSRGRPTDGGKPPAVGGQELPVCQTRVRTSLRPPGSFGLSCRPWTIHGQSMADVWCSPTCERFVRRCACLPSHTALRPVFLEFRRSSPRAPLLHLCLPPLPESKPWRWGFPAHGMV